MLADAVKWGSENGLKEPVNAVGPSRVEFNLSGYGFVVVLKETSGRGRMGTASYTATGKRSMWNLDTPGSAPI